jgi:hypothetical protein
MPPAWPLDPPAARSPLASGSLAVLLPPHAKPRQSCRDPVPACVCVAARPLPPPLRYTAHNTSSKQMLQACTLPDSLCCLTPQLTPSHRRSHPKYPHSIAGRRPVAITKPSASPPATLSQAHEPCHLSLTPPGLRLSRRPLTRTASSRYRTRPAGRYVRICVLTAAPSLPAPQPTLRGTATPKARNRLATPALQELVQSPTLKRLVGLKKGLIAVRVLQVSRG